MGDGFLDLGLGEAVLDAVGDVPVQLVDVSGRDEPGDRGEAPITGREPLAFPDVPEQHVIGEGDELRSEAAKHLLHVGLRVLVGHE
jgi:hypothetical protein